MVARDTEVLRNTATEEGSTGCDKSRTSHGEGNLGRCFYFKRIEVLQQNHIK